MASPPKHERAERAAAGVDAPALSRLSVEVVWGDITKVEGDVHVVGHYVGVLPQNAERALDEMLSSVAAGAKQDSNLILTDLTRRGAIRGSLGDVIFFPWQRRGHVVLAGMGRVGTFSQPQLRILARSLAQAVGRLLERPTICSVLIGSGFGNLRVPEAVGGLLTGIGEALTMDPALELGTLRIVERNLDKAYEILEELHGKGVGPIVSAHRIKVAPDIVEGGGGGIPIPFGFSWMLAVLARACHQGEQSSFWGNADGLLKELPATLRIGVLEALRKLGARHADPRRLAASAFRLGGDPEDRPEFSDRVSFHHDGSRLSGGAIMNMATVKATDLDVGQGWVDRIVEGLDGALPDDADRRAIDAFRFLVHPDLREKLQDDSKHLVIEVDRAMARVPWEMLRADASRDPLGVHRPIARQLRTAYSPALSAMGAPRPLRMLVIGDADDSLPFALAEARAVAAIAKRHHVDVDLRLGSPDELGLGKHDDAKPADLFEVLGLLLAGEFDLVHYCGHAEFVPQYPERSGWKFKEEHLTPSKLEGIDRPPRLIVANACLSAAISQKTSDGRGAAGSSGTQPLAAGEESKRRPVGDSRLVASLADEFFKRGVADYIGTAWEVPDGPAQLFAETFWGALLQGYDPTHKGADAPTLGTALQEARRALYARRSDWREFATVWAAYQHYGDPTRGLWE